MSIRNRSSRRALRLFYGLAFLPVVTFNVAICAPAIAQTSRVSLALDDALQAAIKRDPAFAAAAASVDAAKGGLKQSKARANPELSIDVENFDGRDELKGFGAAETTYGVSQEVDLSGQRRARIGVAERELHGAELQHLIRGLDLIRDVQTAYFDALAADEQVTIARERVTTAQALQGAVGRRVAAARDPLMAGARADAALAEAEIALTRALADAASARVRLASYIGADSFTLTTSYGILPVHDHEIPSDKMPDLARLATDRDRAGAAIKLERSLAWASPTISLGFRRFEERNGDGALVAGFSVPLKLFDRNQGNVARAKAEERRAGLDLEAGRQAIAREYATLAHARGADMQAVTSLERDVIPKAARALDLARDGYGRGAFSYLDVLDAQRALTDAREARLSALKSLHTNDAALDRLVARFADMLPIEDTHQ